MVQLLVGMVPAVNLMENPAVFDKQYPARVAGRFDGMGHHALWALAARLAASNAKQPRIRPALPQADFNQQSYKKFLNRLYLLQ